MYRPRPINQWVCGNILLTNSLLFVFLTTFCLKSSHTCCVPEIWHFALAGLFTFSTQSLLFGYNVIQTRPDCANKLLRGIAGVLCKTTRGGIGQLSFHCPICAVYTHLLPGCSTTDGFGPALLTSTFILSLIKSLCF